MKTSHPLRKICTRLVDVVGSLAALVLFSPLFLAAAILIATDDGLPIFHRQTRVGKNGKPFLILKFRTMRTSNRGPAITAAGDRRVTRVGAWLRKFKIDELPQFLNVLRGEMSLIGPRPEVPEYVQFDDGLWQAVLSERPGITDLASLVFRDEEEILGSVADTETYYRSAVLPTKLRLNLHYQRNRSLTRDFRLLWLTARYSFFPRGFDRDQVVRSLGGFGPRNETTSQASA